MAETFTWGRYIHAFSFKTVQKAKPTIFIQGYG